MWTIQEVALARKALLICGSSEIDWDVFVYAAYRLSKYEGEAYGSSGSASELWAAADLHHTVTEMFSSRVTVSDLRSRIPTTVSSILFGTGGKGATDPKDRVYSLYGIFTALGVHIPKPDYTRDLHNIYREATQAAILADESLEALEHTLGLSSLTTNGMASWADTWTDQHVARGISSMFSASSHGSSPAYSFSEDGRKLTVRGQIIDTVSARSKIVAMEDGPDQPGDDVRVTLAPFTTKTVKMYQEWILLLHQIPGFPGYIAGDSAPRAFHRMLVQDGSMTPDGVMQLPTLEKGFLKWYGLMVSNLDEETKLPNATARDYLDWLPESLYYLTKTEEWDIMQAILADREEAGLFQMHADYHSKLKVMFLTEGGLIGTASRLVEEGDMVVLVAGVSVPLLLRPTGQDEGEFKVVGPAYVQGVMYGERWEEGNTAGGTARNCCCIGPWFWGRKAAETRRLTGSQAEGMGPEAIHPTTGPGDFIILV